MRITSVTYRRLKSGPGFTHEAVEASASVEPHEDPEAVLNDLVAFVAEKLGETPRPERARELASRLYDVANQIEEIRSEVTADPIPF